MKQNRASTNSLGFLLEAQEAIHVGNGEGSEWVDLPIQRQSNTRYPSINDATWKGAVLSKLERKEFITPILGFSDLTLLLFPIRSSHHIFSYVTCPDLIERYIGARDRHGYDKMEIDKILAKWKQLGDTKALHFNCEDEEIMLGNISFQTVKKGDREKDIINNMKVRYKSRKHILENLVIISDSNMRQIMLEQTEKKVRNQLDQDKKSKNVFSTEYLPENTVMYGFATEFYDVKKDKIYGILEELKKIKKLFIGGDYSIGKGSFIMYGDEEKNGK